MESTELTPGSRLPHCWHTALTSNTTNISSTPSQTSRNRVPQKECTCTHTHTWTSLCPRRHPRDARMCQHTHTHWNPLIQLSHLQKAWVEYTDAHHNTSHQTSEEEGKKKKGGRQVHGGRQTDRVSDPPSLVCCRFLVLCHFSSSQPRGAYTTKKKQHSDPFIQADLSISVCTFTLARW